MSETVRRVAAEVGQVGEWRLAVGGRAGGVCASAAGAREARREVGKGARRRKRTGIVHMNRERRVGERKIMVAAGMLLAFDLERPP